MHCFHHICSVERNFTTVEIQFREQQPILHTYSQWGVENAEKTLLIRLSYIVCGVCGRNFWQLDTTALHCIRWCESDFNELFLCNPNHHKACLVSIAE